MKTHINKNGFKKFKILGVFNAYFALNAKECPISGGEKRFFEVFRRWSQQGLDISILTTRMGYNTCVSQKLSASYKIVPFSFVDKLGVASAYFFRTIIACFLTPKFRSNLIIYTETDIIPDIIPAIITKLLNRNSKMVCTIFHFVPHYSLRTGSRVVNFISYCAQAISFKFIERFADIIFVDNSLLKQDLITKKGFSGTLSEKILVSYMGINKKYIDEIKADGKVKYDGFFLGRFHVSKGIFDLIEIWNLVVKKNKKAKLAICGTADEGILGDVNKKIRSFGLEKNIFYLGFLPTDEVFENLKSSKVFVFPSHEEGWGIAVCEAMACGLPVVAYDLPVFKEVFPKGMARIKIDDYRSFAETIIRLLNNEKEYQNLSNEAVKIASQYDWDDVAERELCYIMKIKESE